MNKKFFPEVLNDDCSQQNFFSGGGSQFTVAVLPQCAARSSGQPKPND